MTASLKTKRVAILVTDGFEQVELTEPRKALERAGAETHIVSPAKDTVRAWNQKKWGKQFVVDRALADVNPQDYDALLLPGGVMSPDRLRMNREAVNFVRHFVENHKPIAAICHGPWTLIETKAVAGRTMTSWPSLKTDIHNAGGTWVDQEVIVDGGIVTSRKPEDIPRFNAAMIDEFRKDGVRLPEEGRKIA
ncbi:MAG TPA: type 1 glutamine amidotransferase domain-containing protein [Terriglobia bacterium]|nr:type 1 glutamine amidotransferase domain-containing protein [Terriglobia bacterium]